MVKRIVVDRSLCDGNGLCVAEAPEYFALDDNDELRLLRESCDDEDVPQVQRAVGACPKAALRLEG